MLSRSCNDLFSNDRKNVIHDGNCCREYALHGYILDRETSLRRTCLRADDHALCFENWTGSNSTCRAKYADRWSAKHVGDMHSTAIASDDQIISLNIFAKLKQRGCSAHLADVSSTKSKCDFLCYLCIRLVAVQTQLNTRVAMY